MNGTRLAEAMSRLVMSGVIVMEEGLLPGQAHVEEPDPMMPQAPQPPQPRRSVQVGRFYKVTEYACKDGSVRQVPMLLRNR